MDWLTRRQALGVAVLAGLAVAATFLCSTDSVLTALVALSERPLAFAAGLALLYLVRPLFVWPISPISALVGYVLGVRYGIPVALVGAVVTSMPPFLVTRYTAGGGATTEGIFGRLGHAGRQVIDVTGATRGVLAARLSPLPADPVSYGAGFSGLTVRAFVVGTFFGEIPWVVLEVLAGSSMRQVSLEGLGVGADAIVGLGALAVLVLAEPLYRYVRRDQPT